MNVGFSRKLETIANIATTCVALLLAIVLVKVYLVPEQLSRKPALPEGVRIGASLKGRVPGIDWSRSGRTFVLAISTQCHFCTEEYGLLSEASTGSGEGHENCSGAPPIACRRRAIPEGGGCTG
jgi:hypothetical protein